MQNHHCYTNPVIHRNYINHLPHRLLSSLPVHTAQSKPPSNQNLTHQNPNHRRYDHQNYWTQNCFHYHLQTHRLPTTIHQLSPPPQQLPTTIYATTTIQKTTQIPVQDLSAHDNFLSACRIVTHQHHTFAKPGPHAHRYS